MASVTLCTSDLQRICAEELCSNLSVGLFFPARSLSQGIKYQHFVTTLRPLKQTHKEPFGTCMRCRLKYNSNLNQYASVFTTQSKWCYLKIKSTWGGWDCGWVEQRLLPGRPVFMSFVSRIYFGSSHDRFTMLTLCYNMQAWCVSYRCQGCLSVNVRCWRAVTKCQYMMTLEWECIDL